ncbi:MAG: hypothetical protein ACI9S8_002195 [Chlamydiales bacterium]|jgi:hypothetical protein
MKIDDKIISIPRYISTTWENVSSLRVSGEVFIVSLIDDSHIEIPNLDNSTIEQAFQAHIDYVEKTDDIHTQISASEESQYPHPFSQLSSSLLNNENIVGLPIRFGQGGLESFGAAMQHNPAQKDMPELPEELLQKISSIAKILGNDENMTLPKAEPHCNCIFCQIANAIQGVNDEEVIQDEEVTDEDLKFREWDIDQSNDKLYSVSNPLDSKEVYSVYLGNPVGCTCGEKNCDHIRAVLNS